MYYSLTCDCCVNTRRHSDRPNLYQVWCSKRWSTNTAIQKLRYRKLLCFRITNYFLSKFKKKKKLVERGWSFESETNGSYPKSPHCTPKQENWPTFPPHSALFISAVTPHTWAMHSAQLHAGPIIWPERNQPIRSHLLRVCSFEPVSWVFLYIFESMHVMRLVPGEPRYIR